MDDANFRLPRTPLPRTPLGPDAKINTQSISFVEALAHKDRSRHSGITTGLYSYLRYKVWTEKVRDAFEETK
jgi:hypothetical protein